MDLALILFAVATLAGLVDAIAGGGGLITVPALLWSGLDPVSTLATNKAQGVFGSGSATANFARQGALNLRLAFPAVVCSFAGAAAGAVLVQHLGGETLARIVPLLLIAFALYFLFSPRVSDLDSHRRLGEGGFALLVGTGVGFYDGFFGPGTGTFFAIGYVALLGYNLRRATAHTKLLNFASNLGALLFFMAAMDGGHVGAAGAIPDLAAMDGGHVGAAGAIPDLAAMDGGHVGAAGAIPDLAAMDGGHVGAAGAIPDLAAMDGGHVGAAGTIPDLAAMDSGQVGEAGAVPGLTGGHVVWAFALPMAAGQFIGAWLGSHLVLRHGARLVRPVLVLAALAVSVKLLLDR